jgi:hypothetical protein
MPRWFRRIADIPGLDYPGSKGVDRSRLPGHNARPTTETFTADGERHQALTWRTSGGTTSASPAAQLKSDDDSAAGLLRHVNEVLELPGEPSDYHFAIQHVIECLWERREPETLAELERLCWLDIRLLEAAPKAIAYKDNDGVTRFPSVFAFFRLITLYEQDGFLHDALAVAERGRRFEQTDDECKQLRERIANLESDDRI